MSAEKKKMPIVSGEFGVVPSPSSGSPSSPLTTIREIWIDVQSERRESQQRDLLCGPLFQCFSVQCPQSNVPAFKNTFGDGTALVAIVCRTFCREARAALKNSSSHADYLSSSSYKALLGYMHCLCDPSFYSGIVEKEAYEDVVRTLSLHNIPSMLSALHVFFLDNVRLKTQAINEQAVMTEQKLLSLVQILLVNPSEHVLRDLQSTGSAQGFFYTFSVCLNFPFAGSSSISALALDIVGLLVKPEARVLCEGSDLFFSKVISAFTLEGNTNITSKQQWESAQCSATLYHTLAALQHMYQHLVPTEQQDLPVFEMAQWMLTLQNALSQNKKQMERLCDVFLSFATMETNKSHNQTGSETQGKKKSKSIFSFVSGAISTLANRKGRSGADTDAKAERKVTITNRRVLAEATRFVCVCDGSTARQVMARKLFRWVTQANLEDEIRSLIVKSSIESLSSFELPLLGDFLEMIEELTALSSSSFYPDEVFSSLIHVVSTQAVNISTSHRILSFLTTIGSNESLAIYVIRSGVIPYCVDILHHIAAGDAFEILHDALDSPTDMLDLAAQVAFQWKVLLRFPEAIDAIDECSAAPTILSCVYRTTEGHGLVSRTGKTLSSIARDMYIALVSVRPRFISSLLDLLLTCTGEQKWNSCVSDLLATFASVLHGSRCAEEAIRQNSIEVCLSLLQAADGSHNVAVDVHLLATCISFMLPLVKFSEVGRMLFVSTPKSFRGSAMMCQFMINLASGACRHSSNITSITQFLDSPQGTGSPLANIGHVTEFLAPNEEEDYFTEYIPPLGLLCKWYTAAVRGESSQINTSSLLAAIRVLIRGTRSYIKNESFCTFVFDHKLYDLLPFVSSVAPLKKEFFGSCNESLKLWNASLLSGTPRTKFPHAIHFLGSGAAYGLVDAGSDGWPSNTGFTVAMWCHYTNKNDQSPRSSFSSFVDGASLCSSTVATPSAYFNLWSLSWVTADTSTQPAKLSLKIDITRGMTVLTLLFNKQETTVPFPQIPSGRWVHVAIVHQRHKLYPSEVSFFLDGKKVKKQNVPYPVQIVAQAAGFPSAQKFNCVIGLDKKENATVSTHLLFSNFQIYDDILSAAMIRSLVVASQLSLPVSECGSSASLKSFVYGLEELNLLAIANFPDSPEALVEIPPRNKLILALHAMASLTSQASFSYLDNKDWILKNLASPSAPDFVLQGTYAEPSPEYESPAHFLVANGGLDQLIEWLGSLAAEGRNEMGLPTLQQRSNSAKILELLGECIYVVDTQLLRSRELAHSIYSAVAVCPSLFFSRSGCSAIVALCVRWIPEGYLPNSSPEEDDEMEGHAVLVNVPLAEMVLLNLLLLGSQADDHVEYVLHVLIELVSPTNMFCAVNAQRVLQAQVTSGFVYGMARTVLSPKTLTLAVAFIERLLIASHWDYLLLSELFTFCAHTIPVMADVSGVFHRLGSSLVSCVDYIILLRNSILRMLHGLSKSDAHSEAFILACNAVCPVQWIALMTDRYSHPVTVVLALDLMHTIICLNSSMRANAEKHNMLRWLMNNLQAHCHQDDLIRLLMCCSLGIQFIPLDPAKTLMSIDAKPTLQAHPTFFVLFMQALKFLAMSVKEGREQRTSRQRELKCAQYFGEFSALERRWERSTKRRKWRRACWAVIFVYRCQNQMKLLPEPANWGHLFGNAVLDLDESARRSDLIAVSLEVTKNVFLDNELFCSIFYTQGTAHNPIDSLSWILLCTMPNEGIPEAVLPDAPANSPYSLVAVVNDSDDEEVAPASSQAFSRRTSSWCSDILSSPVATHLYEAAISVFQTYEEKLLAAPLIVAISGNKTSFVVLALHHIINTCPEVGDIATDWFHSQIITLWSKTVLNSILKRQPLQANESTTNAVKTATHFAQYLADRFVSGLSTPVGAVMTFFASFCEALQGSHFAEQAKLVKNLLLDSALFMLSPEYHEWYSAKTFPALDLVYQHRKLIFGSQQPTADILKWFVIRLVELSLSIVPDFEATLKPEVIRLSEVWQTLFVANHSSPVFSSILVDNTAGQRVDLLHGGFDTLYLKIGASDTFLGWFADNKYFITEFFRRTVAKVAKRKHLAAHAKRHLRWATKDHDESLQDTLRFQTRIHEAATAAFNFWSQHSSSTTLADPLLLRPAVFTPPARFVVDESQTDEKYYERQVVSSVSKDSLGRDSRGGLPIGCYIAHFGAIGNPFAGCEGETKLTHIRSALSLSAELLVSRLLTPGLSQHIHWAGNVYVIAGVDSIICSMFITNDECIVVSCSQVTEHGDFFIALPRKHEAASKQVHHTIMQDVIMWFLPRAPAQAVTSASTKASFQHSQYYRQLRSEALQRNANGLVWNFSTSKIKEVHQRRFQHQPAALEFVLEDKTQFFVVVLDKDLAMSKAERQAVVACLGDIIPWVTVENTAIKKAKVLAAQKRWMKRQLTNKEYLDVINDAASRTTADLCQYPVFPWILSDFSSSSLSLENPAVYRDLEKPIGALNAQHCAAVVERYQEWLDDTQPPFHHGTHYSTSAVVMYYLVRLQPLTSMAIKYQGGKLDVADRLFHSIEEAWQSCSGGLGSDVKELIPEFFFLPSFFLNHNKIDLGVKRDGTSLNHVVLPPWCGGNPNRFIAIQRAALEGDIVSQSLHSWVDLVFGSKQRGEEAEKAVNVFHHLTYDEGLEEAMGRATSEEDRKAIVASVDNFGITPKNVFKSSHPKRGPPSAISLQQTFLGGINSMTKRQIITQHPTPAAANMAVVELFELDSAILCSSTIQRFSNNKPLQYVAWNPFTSSLTVCVPKEHVVVSTVSSPSPFGPIVVFKLSSCGNMLCCGTRRGCVLVYHRSCPSAPFSLTRVLQLGSNSRCVALALFEAGLVLCACEEPSAITCWQLSHHGATFCFRFDIFRDSDRIVRSFSRDTFTGNFFVAFDHWILMLSAQGEKLAERELIGMTIAANSKSSPAGKRPQQQSVSMLSSLQEPITSLGFVPFSSFSLINVLMCGHGDGAVSFWIVNLELSNEEGAAMGTFSINYFGGMSTDRSKAVTAVLPTPSHHRGSQANGFVVGYEDGVVCAYATSPAQQSSSELSPAQGVPEES